MTSPVQAEPVSPPLEYAPARDGRRRLRRAMRLTLLAMLLAIVGCVIYWRVPLWAHAQLHIQQRQCANYTQAPDVVIASSTDKGRDLFAAPIPDCWTDYRAGGPPLRAGLIRGLSTNPNHLALAFLHRLKSPAGHERIVAIHCETTYLTSGSIIQSLQPVAIEPASFWSFSARPVFHSGTCHYGYPARSPTKMFAGQPDPNDPAKFTIAYAVEGKPGVVEGKLNDDNTVTLDLRKGSAMAMDRVAP